MYIDGNTIITTSGILTAIGVMLGLLLKIHKWYLRQEDLWEEMIKLKDRHKNDINDMNEENGLICEALVACLDGLQQLGANHNVPIAKDKLQSYLNEQAHK